MSTIYSFHDQAGVIPGIPGVFSHCTVEVDDEGSVHILGQPERIAEEEPTAQEAPAMPIEQQAIVVPQEPEAQADVPPDTQSQQQEDK
jgi:hypothetical protein